MTDKDLSQTTGRIERADVISSLYWKVGYAQNIGSRSQQQDSVGAVLGTFRGKPALLAILADGMGGMKDGAEFSRIAVDYHQENFQRILDASSHPPYALLTLALQANEEAHKIYDEDKPGGTTLTSALFVDDRFYTLSVGDSRIYLFRKNIKMNRYVPLQLNREHVLGAALDERAWMGKISFEDAEDNMFRDSLTSAIGGERVRRVDLTENATRFIGGDKLALMSDGVYRALTDMELSDVMDREPNPAADGIISRICGKKIPHQDNMSILIVERV